MQAHPFSAEEEDALREVANILIGHAATALARMSRTRIDIEIPRIAFLDWHRGLLLATEGARLIAGVRTKMLGKLVGDIYVTFPRDSALALTDVLRDLPAGTTRYMSVPAATTLLEVGNVIAGSCLAAFYQLLDISLVHSVPEFVYDTPDALVADGVQGGEEGTVLIAQVNFHAPEIDLSGHLILLFTLESMSQLLDALGASGAR